MAEKQTIVDAFKVKLRRATGAHDCCDAADIIAYLVGFDTRERLMFSNACASLYASNISRTTKYE